jgi:predicted RNA polymerase sigma factor
VAAYAQARDLTLNDRERAFLTRRIAECEEASKSPREGA